MDKAKLKNDLEHLVSELFDFARSLVVIFVCFILFIAVWMGFIFASDFVFSNFVYGGVGSLDVEDGVWRMNLGEEAEDYTGFTLEGYSDEDVDFGQLEFSEQTSYAFENEPDFVCDENISESTTVHCDVEDRDLGSLEFFGLTLEDYDGNRTSYRNIYLTSSELYGARTSS